MAEVNNYVCMYAPDWNPPNLRGEEIFMSTYCADNTFAHIKIREQLYVRI